MPIEWNDNLKSGIQIIDEQHQELIVMLNRFGRFRCGKDCFNEAFAELEDFANTHFKEEEDLMASLNYPKYKEHKTCHDEFVETLKNFKEKIKNHKNTHEFGEEIIELGENWITNHYSNEDIELVKYIKETN